MDLFVVDVAGDNTPLEDRNCPYVPVAGPSRRRVETQTRPDSDEDEESSGEDDQQDGEDELDFGLFPATFATLDISNFIPEVASKPKDKIDVEVDEFISMLTQDTDDTICSRDHLGKSIVAKEMKTSVIVNIEQEKTLPNPSEKNKAKLRKLEASKTKGSNWFNMPATEVTEEVQRDLEVIQMRSVLDPKHFYKKNDLKALPKYFQVGKVLPSPLEHYNDRGEKKNKKKTIVDELMADAQFQKFNKRKYTETVEEKKRSGYSKAHDKMKKLKKAK